MDIKEALKKEDLFKNMPLYLFVYGEEAYYIKLLENKIKSFFNQEIRVFWEDLSEESFFDLISSKSIFKKENAVIIKGAKEFLSKIKNLDLLEKFLKSKNISVIFIENGPITEKDLNKGALNVLKKLSFLFIESKAPSLTEIKSIVSKKFKKENIDLKDEDINYIINICGKDLTNLKNETDKLLLYAFSKKDLTKEDLKKVLSYTYQAEAFSILSAILDKNTKKALFILSDVIKQGVYPLVILSHLQKQFSMMYIYKALIKKESEEKVLNAIGIKTPFQKNIFLSNIKKTNEDFLKKAINYIAQADIQIKVFFKDMEEVLENTIIKLCS